MDLIYKGKKYQVETNGEQIVIDGNPKNAEIKSYSDHILKIRIGEEEKAVYVATDDKFAYVFIDGEQFVIQKSDDSETKIEVEEEGKDKNIEQIKPPMPGSVVKVLVEVGQKVDEGAPIIVVEAMKMEITLYSSIEGVISQINVEAGQQVDSEQVLVVISKEEIK
jgi:biotin carboxyl carrier protein